MAQEGLDGSAYRPSSGEGEGVSGGGGGEGVNGHILALVIYHLTEMGQTHGLCKKTVGLDWIGWIGWIGSIS